LEQTRQQSITDRHLFKENEFNFGQRIKQLESERRAFEEENHECKHHIAQMSDEIERLTKEINAKRMVTFDIKGYHSSRNEEFYLNGS
jgi:septal ring factor EnvC (AmiA/AmiB activator)